jgi:DEAD/DEAH box helicase domain-containing protein
MEPSEFLRNLQEAPGYRGQIAHVEVVPAREARFAEPAQPVPEGLATGLREAQGIERLWTHQVEALEAARRGEHVCVVSGTASGKSLCYSLPILERCLADPEACALFLFPTKALAQDQLRHLRELREHCPDLPLAHTYDGDLSQSGRQKVRQAARLILSNPDMLHVNILPNHPRWSRFLSNLRFVVVDEIHVLRGIFGSHCAHLFRRLARLAARYQAREGGGPQFICCSATIGNPREHAEALIGRDVTLIDDDGSPQGRRFFVFWNPPVVNPLSQRRRSAHVEAVELLTDLVRSGFRTIAFTKWWGATELVARYAREKLADEGLGGQIESYRGGYLASHRRDVEKRLFDGDLRAVVSTNALELGVNIGGLQSAVILGFPGTISATWQQAGRAGRGIEDSLAVLVAYDTAINQYLMNFPGYFFSKENEKALIAPRNRHILAQQLACAAHEVPLARGELETFVAGKVSGHLPMRDIEALVKRQQAALRAHAAADLGGPKEEPEADLVPRERRPSAPVLEDDADEAVAEAATVLGLMEDEGLVRWSGGRWYYTETTKPAYRVSLRAITKHNYTIVDMTDPEHEAILGEIDQISAYPILHPEAIYFHAGEQFYVEKLDLERKRAEVRRVNVDYYTSPWGGRGVSVIHNVEERAEFPGGEVWFGDVQCHFNTDSYDKIKLWSRQAFERRPVNLPPQILETVAYWVNPRSETTDRILASGRDPEAGRYGLGQALMVTTALFASCDPLDVRTSEASDAECARWGCNRYSAFIFDNHQGALGFTELAFSRIEELLETTLSLIEECPCEDGCPFCVGFYLRPVIRHDPENSEGQIPDKEAALMILHDVLGLAPYQPKPPTDRGWRWRQRVQATPEAQPGGVAEETPAKADDLPDYVKGQIRRRLGERGKL